MLVHIKDSNGFPVIPASSFKGAVSTNFLALSGDSKLTSNLFGAPGYLSKVFFHDIKASNPKTVFKEVLRLWQPNIRKQNHVKFYIRRALKTKFFGIAECIPRDTILSAKIVGHNLNDVEMGGILCSLGYGFEDATFKIGYAKPQGFGQMILNDLKIYRYNFNGFKLEKIEEERDAFVEKFREHVERRGFRCKSQDSICKGDLMDPKKAAKDLYSELFGVSSNPEIKSRIHGAVAKAIRYASYDLRIAKNYEVILKECLQMAFVDGRIVDRAGLGESSKVIDDVISKLMPRIKGKDLDWIYRFFGYYIMIEEIEKKKKEESEKGKDKVG
ncbi:MAG: hypothetical protein PWQ22_660 [Archaeoglobaceae archaeon]|nr:hypothetical protein [Archaeoglobaceae archaeon]MDK2876250.1 hypothetical protein [Archaeoglobaceae archaeon]